MTKDYLLNIRCPKELRENFALFCDSCGLTMSEAVNMLVQEAIAVDGVPFRIGVTDMSGIKEMSGNGFEDRFNVRINKENREAFTAVCKGVGLPMAKVVKMFMIRCLHEGKIPF